MRAAFVVMSLVAAAPTAHARGDMMNLSIGTGATYADSPGFVLRMNEIVPSTRGDGMTGGGICDYDYWRGADGSGFSIPIGGFLGARVGSVMSAFTAGVGVLAFESWHGNAGFGVVPQVGTMLGLQIDRTHTIAIDARAARHVLAGTDDFTTWSVLVMIGKDFRD